MILPPLHFNGQNPRGPGFWKMNTSFLLEDEYIPDKEKKKERVGNEYENNEDVDAPLLWDTRKMHMRSASLNYTRRKMRKLKLEEATPEKDMLLLQRRLEQSIRTDTKTNLQKDLEVKILQREEIVKYKTQGATLRSRSRLV